MGHGDLAGLVATLLGVRHLVFNLDGAGAGFDHLLGQQVSGFLVTEAGIDVGNQRNNMGLKAVDFSFDSGAAGAVVARLIQLREQVV